MLINMNVKILLIVSVLVVNCYFSDTQLIHVTNSSQSRTDIRIGLLFSDRKDVLTYLIFKPSCDIAIENINSQPHLFNNIYISYVWSPTSDNCGRPVLTAPGTAAQLYYDHKPMAIIGPPCSNEVSSIADLANFWNIPILSGTAGASYLDNKLRYRTLSRTSFRLSTLGDFFSRIFQTLRWTAASIIWDDKTSVLWVLLLEAISGSLEHSGAEVNDVILQDHQNITMALKTATRRGTSKLS